MKNQTIAKRYARALLTLGLEDGRLDDYGRELAGLASALTAAEAGALLSPAYPSQTRRAMLEAVLGRAAVSPVVGNFMRLLFDKGRLNELGTVAEVYGRLVDEHHGLTRGELTCAVPVDERELADLQTALGKFTGRQVELTVVQNPAIIGGLVARLGDLTIDGSVRTQLHKLAATLTRA